MTTERTGTFLLVAATLLVALSIVLEGTASRLFNGAGGIAWFGAAVLFVVAVRRTSHRLAPWVVGLGLTVVLAFVVSPSNFTRAVAGFGLAGATIGLVARQKETLWARLIVGLYLPLHVGTALARVAWHNVSGDEASIRTDPPPTAALVPFAMLAAAMAGALVVTWWRQRGGETPAHGGTQARA